jgi:hypothetical protein
MPTHVKKYLMSLIRQRSSSVLYPGYHAILDNRVNEYLSNRFGIVTGEQPRYNLDNVFTVFFNWNIQGWYVGV